ncbi:MAG: Diaminopimelate epimerase [Promethearchaeota archaeon]|nr:MAG: Diaminopimelate epimerase [Candidatus Lokiarchaeota archaeon]
MERFILQNFEFEKFHGLGNDYIIVNDLELQIPENKKAKLAEKLCEWHFSIGADGLIYVCDSQIAEIKMRIFNNDGTEAEMCGNGIRCFSKYIYEHNIIKSQEFDVETLKGIIHARLKLAEVEEVTSVEINMGEPILQCEEIPIIPDKNDSFECINEALPVLDKIFNISAVSMGNPHAVIFVDEQLDDNDLNKYGSAIETHKRFPNKTNVEFVKVISPHECTVRVFERGVGITNSCGTGSCASIVAGVILGKFKRGESVVVHNDGGDLIISFDGENVLMEGPVERVFIGQIKQLEF